MPPKAKPEDSVLSGVLSDKERDVLAMAWAHFNENGPEVSKVNHESLAKALNYKNHKSVMNLMYAATKKLRAMPDGGGDASAAPTTSTPTTPAKGKAKRMADEDGDAGETETPTPTKKVKKTPTKKAKAAAVRDEEEEESYVKGEAVEDGDI